MTWMSASDFRDIGIDVRVLEPSGEQTASDEATPSAPASPPPQPAPEPTPLFAMKGWVAVDIETGNTSFPGFVIRLVDRDQHLSGHIFVGCAPQNVGPYLEFELNDLKQELAGITQAHLPIWIGKVQLDAAASQGSVFLLMDESNVATVEEMSNRLLNPGPQTLVFRASPTASFTITLYDWTSDYARRYEKASGDPFLRMSPLTNACAPPASEASATPDYRTLPNDSASSDAEQYRVNGITYSDVLNMRSGPGTDYPIVAAIPPDASGISVAECQVIEGYEHDWCDVSWHGFDGWVSGGFLLGERTGRPASR